MSLVLRECKRTFCITIYEAHILPTFYHDILHDALWALQVAMTRRAWLWGAYVQLTACTSLVQYAGDTNSVHFFKVQYASDTYIEHFLIVQHAGDTNSVHFLIIQYAGNTNSEHFL